VHAGYVKLPANETQRSGKPVENFPVFFRFGVIVKSVVIVVVGMTTEVASGGCMVSGRGKRRPGNMRISGEGVVDNLDEDVCRER
jgi:hypothetical protein